MSLKARIEAARFSKPDTAKTMLATMRPCIGLGATGGPAAVGTTKFGGLPDLPKGTPWPAAEPGEGDGEDFDEDAFFGTEAEGPLPFLCQLDMAELCVHDVKGLLPKQGLLSIFCARGGLEPAQVSLFHRGPASALARAKPPEGAPAPRGEKPMTVTAGVVFADADGRRQRFDGRDEGWLEKTCEELGIGITGNALGEFFFFRSELKEAMTGKYLSLVRILPEALGWDEFGEGVVHVLISRESLRAGKLEEAMVIIEGGT